MSNQDLYEITTKAIRVLQDMGLQDTHFIVPAAGMHPYVAYDYWDHLYKADTLKYRWSDIDSPKVDDVLQLHLGMSHSYFVVDIETGGIEAEFMLDMFSGKSAQVHFSMRPTLNSRTKLLLADKVSDQILNNWPEYADNTRHFIDSIFGVTPMSNRVARIFIQKAGFKTMGVLVSGTKYLNKVDDALITQKTRVA